MEGWRHFQRACRQTVAKKATPGIGDALATHPPERRAVHVNRGDSASGLQTRSDFGFSKHAQRQAKVFGVFLDDAEAVFDGVVGCSWT